MQSFVENIKIRRDYSKIKSAELIPDLVEMQKKSYESFLQIYLDKKDRKTFGLQSALMSIFPVTSPDGRYILEFVDYSFEQSKYDVNECKQRGATYATPLKVKLRLICNDVNKETGSINVRDIKEQEVHFCDIPLMTENGTFVINGTERVIVSQIYRAPGVFFDHDKGKNTNGKLLYSASIIPHIGSWLDIEFDAKDLLNVRVDKRKKIPLIYLLRALDSKRTEKYLDQATKEGKILDMSLIEGMSNEEIIDTFYKSLSVEQVNDMYTIDFMPDSFRGRKLFFDVLDATTGDVLIKADTLISVGVLKKLEKNNITKVLVPASEIVDKYLGTTIVDSNNQVLYHSGDIITPEILDILKSKNIKNFSVLLIDNINNSSYLLNSILLDRNVDRAKALNEIYKIVKLAEAPNLEIADEFFRNLFFNQEKYDLADVGRVKINEKFNCNDSEELRVLTKKDILLVIAHLLKIKEGKEEIDDIDHLGNRRVRSVGELVENELRIALLRVERYAQEKMLVNDDLMPSDLLNVKAIQANLREFFGTSQLSQFMDQTNPLSEITHKRRLSALGPKGLSRDRASFEVRDVHLTHYGRICPIETPEGPNIGLINSLAVYAKINKYGFLETPYRVVKNCVVTDEVVYINATSEKDHIIAQATSKLDKNNTFVADMVTCRVNGEITLSRPEDITYMDVSPKQLVSVAASLVPFLENDDANRALMGANMQRQAVPLLKSEAPIVGTGMEALVARDSGVAVIAHNDGVVHYVDGIKIIIKHTKNKGGEAGVDVYPLKKFQRSNHNTCVNQKPIVKVGDEVKKGAIIADGHSIDNGELALGKNVLVAFMPWNGYNFEDSILISERIVKDDVFTSVHIEEFEVVARDTKLGAEEITADIPNIGDDSLKNLDESGIVYVGAEVKSGDILVGKVTPKAEGVITSEEKLLRAIFGEKAVDVKDTSLRLASGISGTVIGVRVFARRGIEKDNRTQYMERSLIEILTYEKEEEFSILEATYVLKLVDLLENQEVVSAKNLDKGSILTKDILDKLKLSDLFKVVVKDKNVMVTLSNCHKDFELAVVKINKIFEDKLINLKKGDELPSGVLKMVKIFIAVKRKLQPGDKMAGRHGNKGVVSRMLPIEDMPHLEDGTVVDICLNPLGVPSRMNVGQVLEVHLGWASANIGKKITHMIEEYNNSKLGIADIKSFLLKCYGHNEIDRINALSNDELISLAKNIKKGMPVATSVFDGVKEKDIDDMFELTGLDNSGQVTLIDGRTGDAFERKVTVGYIYMLKLHHLVDDKIHARSIGPYSLITQQPLGGKAQFGGQRFGEMEVWALEAYGAAYILQEMLTVKSDDQTGRTQVYESIIKGDETFETGIPESFNVLVKELRSLCLNLEMKKNDE